MICFLIRGWTHPWQPKMKVKFRGCQHTRCWICITLISKPPSKHYFGVKIVMIFARQPRDGQPPDSLLIATRKVLSVFIFGIFVVTLVFWFVDSRKCAWEKIFSWQLVDNILTAWQHPDSQGVFTLCFNSMLVFWSNPPSEYYTVQSVILGLNINKILNCVHPWFY